MPLYGYVWLYRVMYAYVGLCMAMYSCMPMHGYLGLCRVVYHYVGSCMAMYGYAWLCRVV